MAIKQPTLQNIKAELKKYYSVDMDSKGYFDSPDSGETSNKTEFILNLEKTTSKKDRPIILSELSKKFNKIGLNSIYTADAAAKKRSSAGLIAFNNSDFYIIAKVIETQLKPSNIKPSIVNDWLTPEEIVRNVEKYIKSQDIEGQAKKQILELLKLTLKDNNSSIPFNAPNDIVPAEFYEILTAIKLGVLLRANDKTTFKTLGIPPKLNLSQSKIRIKIPKQANMPLLDYYLSIKKDDDNDDDALKISVKSKVKSPETNTVKFADIFDDKKSVENWYNELINSAIKKNERGQKIIAESAMEIYQGAGKGGMFSGRAQVGVPLNAVLNLLNDANQNSKIVSILKEKFKLSDKETVNFKNSLQTIFDNIRILKKDDDLIKVITDRKELLSVSAIISNNLKQGGLPAEAKFKNIGIICEKILQTASKKTNQTNYNFYEMFFDEVLRKKELAYAITTINGGQLKYNFYSKVNFASEYKNWIELRSKATDVIGLSV
jgi:hypothetical protein